MELPARQIHPGVWKFNFGAPGKIMPVATRHCPPAAAGLGIMGYLYLDGPIDPAPTRAIAHVRDIWSAYCFASSKEASVSQKRLESAPTIADVTNMNPPQPRCNEWHGQTTREMVKP